MSKEIRRKELHEIDLDSIWTVVACHNLQELCTRDIQFVKVTLMASWDEVFIILYPIECTTITCKHLHPKKE